MKFTLNFYLLSVLFLISPNISLASPNWCLKNTYFSISKTNLVSKILKDGTKISVLPFYLPVKIINKLSKVELIKIPFQIIKEDGVAITGYLGLYLSGHTPSELFLGNVIGVNHNELYDVEKEFITRDGVIVGINGVSPNQRFLHAADYMTGIEKVDNINRFQKQAVSPINMIEKLLTIYKKTGPINKLILAGHGSSGSILIGNELFNLDWIQGNQHYLDSLPKDLFAPNASVILISCSTAQSFSNEPDNGTQNLKKIFAPLLKQGGTVRASTRYVNPNLDKIPSQYYERGAGEVMIKHYAEPLFALLESTLWAISDSHSQKNKIIDIKIDAQK